jgi:putative lysine transport system ATP-binding protein
MSVAIEFKDVHKAFGDDAVLNGISLQIESGSVTSIIGPSGSGKSTLLRCINQLEDIQQGSILYEGELREDVNKLRSDIQMVFQSFYLFDHLTVLENCTIGQIKVLGVSKTKSIEIAMKYLNQVGLGAFKDRKVSQLSGGQKQRVAIARALAMRPKMILFDEPTSALDPEMVGEVLETIKEIIDHSLTFIIVTHEMQFAKDVSDEVIFIDEGLIVERGGPHQLFNAPKTSRLKQFIKRLNPSF